MKELKLETEVRERIRDRKTAKSQRTPRDIVEGLVSVDKITYPFCQQDHFVDRCSIVTNVSSRKTKCYNISRVVTSVQREGINQEVVKAREHVFNANDDIIQASVKEIKTVKDNKLIMMKVTIQRRVATTKIAKSKNNSQTHQKLQLTP